eukprot:2582266-Amphidinium_carterae.1
MSWDPLCQRIWRPAAASVALLSRGARVRGAACGGVLVRSRLCGAIDGEVEVREDIEAISKGGGATEAGGAVGGGNCCNVESEPWEKTSAGVGELPPRPLQEL